MKRRTLDLTLATVGLVVAIVMALAGGILIFASSFTSNTVSTELPPSRSSSRRPTSSLRLCSSTPASRSPPVPRPRPTAT